VTQHRSLDLFFYWLRLIIWRALIGKIFVYKHWSQIPFHRQICQPSNKRTLCFASQEDSGLQLNNSSWRHRYLRYPKSFSPTPPQRLFRRPIAKDVLPSFSHPSSGIRKVIPIHVLCIPNIFVNLTRTTIEGTVLVVHNKLFRRLMRPKLYLCIQLDMKMPLV